jgi:hypothetical protein
MTLKKLVPIFISVLLGTTVVGCYSFKPDNQPTAETPTQTPPTTNQAPPTTTQAPPSNVATTDKVIKATDGQSQISVPDDWEARQDLNQEATLQAGSLPKNVFLIVIPDNKQNFTNFAEYSKIASSGVVSNVQSATIEGPKNLTVNGRVNSRQALQYKIKGSVDGLKVIYLYTNIEGKTQYYQVMAWTIESEFARNEPLFQQITQSFQDLSQ